MRHGAVGPGEAQAGAFAARLHRTKPARKSWVDKHGCAFPEEYRKATGDVLVKRPDWKEYELFEEQEDETWANVGRWFGCTNQGMIMGSPYRYHVVPGSVKEDMRFTCLTCHKEVDDAHLLGRFHRTHYMDDDWFLDGIKEYLGEDQVEGRMALAKQWDITNGIGPYELDWTLSPDPEMHRYGGKFEHELL